MAEAIQFCATHSDQFVARARSEALRAVIAKADELSAQEAALKATLTQRRRSVLEKKRLLIFKDSLLQAGSPDVELPGDMASGFDLSGRLPESRHFETKFRPACITLRCFEGNS